MSAPSSPTSSVPRRQSPAAAPAPAVVDSQSSSSATPSIVEFHRTSQLLSESARNSADSEMWSSVRNPRLQRIPGIEADFDAALKMLIKSPIDPADVPTVTTMVGKKEVQVQDIKVTGLSTLRRHGEVMCADEEDENVRRTASHLFVGPIRMTFKVMYGSWKRRMEVTAEGIVFGIRIKADRDKRTMKLDKFKMETFGLRIRFKGEKTWDPVANCFLRAMNPLIRSKVRQMLESSLAAEITKNQNKTTLKMVRMLYGMKEKPWSGLEGRIFGGKTRK